MLLVDQDGSARSSERALVERNLQLAFSDHTFTLRLSGPVADGVSGVTLRFVGNNVRANVFGVKAVAGIFLLLTAALTGLVARRLGRNAGLATAFVGMNPLMLWQYPGDGHNDTIMAALAMVALLFVIHDRWPQRILGVGAAGASVLAKYALAAAAPLIVAFWFPRWRLLVAAAVLLAGAVVSISFVVDIGVDLREIGPASGLTRNTPWSVLSRKINGTEATNDRLFCLGYLMFSVIAAWIIARHPLATAADLCAAIALLMFAFLFVAAPSLRQRAQESSRGAAPRPPRGGSRSAPPPAVPPTRAARAAPPHRRGAGAGGARARRGLARRPRDA